MTKTPRPFRPYDAEKFSALLARLRKGSVASFGWREIWAAVTAFGGTVEPAVGLVDVTSNCRRSLPLRMTREEAEALLRTRFLPDVVSELPKEPVPGRAYVTAVGPVVADESIWGQTHRFDLTVYEGAEGWRVRLPTPQGEQVREFFPSAYEMPRERNRVSPYDAHRWLAEAGWEAMAARYLGLEEHIPAPERTRDGTGTCGCCFENVKIPGGGIALHGYRRPGDGHVRGRCPGTGYSPFEVSPEASAMYLRDYVLPEVERAQRAQARLADPGPATLLYGYGRRAREITPTDPAWAEALNQERDKAERELARARAEQGAFEALVKNWRPRELPQEGARQINWYVEGQKP